MHHHNAKLMDCDYSKLFYAKREFGLLIAFFFFTLFSVYLKPLLSIIGNYLPTRKHNVHTFPVIV